MDDKPTASLTAAQQTLLDQWLPGATVVHDHSWGLVQTTVLEILHNGGRYILKAGGPNDGHIARELEAHHTWLRPWTSIGRAPELLHGDPSAKLVLTRYLPGELVQDTTAADDPETYRQAGELLALLHGQSAQTDDDLERRERDKAFAWLAKPHCIPAEHVESLHADLDRWPTPPTTIVPTHGDWQTRNWLIDRGTVHAIDFGRAALRPADSDWVRLSQNEFRRDHRFERAFIEGYGGDPREAASWFRTRVREAIGTACWAYAVGDADFEAQGLRLIQEVVDEIDGRDGR